MVTTSEATSAGAGTFANPERRGNVSVVIVNFRGADATLEAVSGLGALDWPASLIEVVVVDNASGDGSADAIRASAPWVTVVEAPENLGFAGGCNLGAAVARGDYLAFLNSDAKPDERWITAAIETFEAQPDVAAVASKVLDWDGKLVDFIDAGLTWFGKGYKPFVGQTAGTLGRREKDVLFGTGSAMLVRRQVFEALGGFDERFFMFYEDVDFGWRLNLRGWRFRYQPASVVYHRHHGTVSRFGSFKETYFLERNALFTLYKNLETKNLNAALPGALALTMRRAVSVGGLDSTAFDFRQEGDDTSADQSVSKETLASVFAVDQFVELLPELAASRDEIQATRTVSDRQLWSLFGRVDAVAGDDSYVSGHDAIVEALPVTTSPRSTTVLVITGDPLGVRMAGPAIRAWNMAKALSTTNDVTLMTLSRLEPVDAPFKMVRVRAGDERAFAPWEKWADVIVFQGHAMAAFDGLQGTSKIVVADVYDPMHLEQLEQGKHLPAATWERHVADATQTLNQQLERADFILCASERQRMFYLGQLAALGRINPATYANDPDLRGLLAVVPFGLDSAPPEHQRSVLKGIHPGIGLNDKVLLWGGGLYNWFDPKTLIRAVASLAERHPEVRLFFQGTKHPHPGVPEMEIVSESRALAADLGVIDRCVFFNDSWVEYSDRQNYLSEADAGVSTHFAHVETTFSFRTRILDYLWAGLPMVVTEGDSFAELVAAEGLGIVVPERDVAALDIALERILFDEDLITASVAAISEVRERFFWAKTLAPLVDFARAPHRAADAAERGLGPDGRPDRKASPRSRRKRGLIYNTGLVLHHLRNGGPVVVVRKIMGRLRSR
jgi:GT2 family glycosyltransferase/glycosyltransferase involved in cell wall biosynthesis